MLYTSGSTGKPKGILHTQAGYLLYASITQQVNSRTHSVSYKLNLITYSFTACVFSDVCLYCSMCLTIDLETFMHVWLTLAGSLATPTWCMVLCVMEPLLSSLRAFPHTLIQVCGIILATMYTRTMYMYNVHVQSWYGRSGVSHAFTCNAFIEDNVWKQFSLETN